ncbi:MAG: exodeoxyribonuclease VII large subunit [SAR202 cluster bacterium]|nr:exodeoxyribonuclease VII large subunit [SAR202 cluster bacterium]
MPIIYPVSKVTRYLRDLLASETLLQDLWVSGEVSNFTRAASGHCYFSLRDATSTLRCVMFRTSSSGSQHLKEGAAVIIHGRVAIYEARGDLQVIADIVQPEGVGELQLKLEALKLKLQQEGLFEPSRKRELPRFPKRAGVITSPTGAVWHDIQTVVRRRYPLVELLLAPTPVQGDTAAPGIVEAFEAMNRIQDVDLVILARGGGSAEDLGPFNEEAVARAIFSSRAPVISAVGHETDFTIADLVADLRAPTPSAAAETAVPDQAELLDAIGASARALNAGVAAFLVDGRGDLERLELRLQRAPPDMDSLRQRVDELLKTASIHARNAIGLSKAQADGLQQRLASLSPVDTLRRGYAIVQAAKNWEIVGDAAQVAAGEAVNVTVSRGGFDATVTSTR